MVKKGKPIVIRDADIANLDEISAMHFEKALQLGCDFIMIEPKNFGEATANWINLGNTISDMAMITGTCSLLSGWLMTDKPFIYLSLSTISLLCSSCHQFVWQKDPCSEYYVAPDVDEKLKEIGIETKAKVVIIKREDNLHKKINVIRMAFSLIAFAFSVWRVFFTP